MACVTRAAPRNNLAAQFIIFSHRISVQSNGGSSITNDCQYARDHETVSSPLQRIARNRQCARYENYTQVLFAAVSGTLGELLGDAKYLGARPAFILALHTWGRSLALHPHIHALVADGGLGDDGMWVPSACLPALSNLRARIDHPDTTALCHRTTAPAALRLFTTMPPVRRRPLALCSPRPRARRAILSVLTDPSSLGHTIPPDAPSNTPTAHLSAPSTHPTIAIPTSSTLHSRASPTRRRSTTAT